MHAALGIVMVVKHLVVEASMLGDGASKHGKRFGIEGKLEDELVERERLA